MDVSKLFDNEHFSDVTIKAGDREVKCHRNVLSLGSDYFQKLLDPSSNFVEKDAKVIKLQEDDPEAVVALLRYIYTSDYLDHSVDDQAAGPTMEFHFTVYLTAQKYLITKLGEKALANFNVAFGERESRHDAAADGEAIFDLMQFLETHKDNLENTDAHIARTTLRRFDNLAKVARFRETLAIEDSASTRALTHAATIAASKRSVYVCKHCFKVWFIEPSHSRVCEPSTYRPETRSPYTYGHENREASTFRHETLKSTLYPYY